MIAAPRGYEEHAWMGDCKLAGKGSSLFGSITNRFVQDREEYGKAVLLLALLFCAVAAAIIGRTAADALFLTRFDNEALSNMYLPQAMCMIISSIVFQRYSHLVRIERLLTILIPIIAGLILISRLGVGLELRWVFPVIYISYDVFNFLMIACFWQFATSILDQRKVKRMIGLVASGGTIGAIASGFGINAIVPIIGTANLIYLFAGLVLLSRVVVGILLRRKSNVFMEVSAVRTPSASNRQWREQKQSGLFRNVPHLKYVVVLAASVTLSLTLIDYQFKVILKETLQDEALAGFMGSFHGISGLIGLVVQFTVSGWVLARFGVLAALLVFPMVLAASSIGLILIPGLAVAAIAKGSDKVLGDTLYASANQLIMFPIPSQWRAKAKNVLDGVVKNGAKGLAAICLLVFSRVLVPEQFSYLILVLLVIGIAAGVKIKKAYLQTLMSTLQADRGDLQKAELNLTDPASRRILTDALFHEDKQQALYALRILRGIDSFDLAPYLARLLEHHHPEVRAEALVLIEQETPEGLEEKLRALLTNSSIPIKAKAVVALAAYMNEDDLENITRLLEDPSVEIQAAAIAALVKYYGIEGMFRAVGQLRRLTESSHEEERTAMAALFGQIGVRSFYKPLLALLQDGSPQVSNRALESAAMLRVPACIPLITERLKDSAVRHHAIEALAAYEAADIVPALEPYWERNELSLYLPAVLERIGTQTAWEKLMSSYDKASFALRDRLLESMLRMNKGVSAMERQQVERLIRLEIQLDDQFNEHGSAIAGIEDCAEITDIVDQIRAAICGRIFQLLSLIYDARAMQAVFVNWSEGDPQRQANAVEVIDQTIQGPVRTALIKLLSATRQLVVTKQPADMDLHLNWLASQGEAWLSSMVGYVMLERQVSSGSAAGIDEDSDARAGLQSILWQDRAGTERLSIQVGQVRLLKKVSLFQGLADRDLAVIAETLQSVSGSKGSTLIREGEPGECLYIIDRGKVGVFKSNRRVHELHSGECFGEMAILTQGPRSATIVAEEDMLMWRLDSQVFYDRMSDQPSITFEMMKLLSRRIRVAMGQEGLLEKEDAAAGSTAVEAARQDKAEEAAMTESGNGVILQRVLVLQQIQLFELLNPDDFLWLAQMVAEIAYAPGEMICRAGEYGDTLYAVIEGTVHVRRGELVYAELTSGDCFGEMAIIDSGPRSADCVAVANTIVLSLDKDQLLTFCFRRMHVLRCMMRVLAERLQRLS